MTDSLARTPSHITAGLPEQPQPTQFVRHFRNVTSIQHDGIVTVSDAGHGMTIDVDRITEQGVTLRLVTVSPYNDRKPYVYFRVIRSSSRNITGLYPTRKAARASIGAV